MSDYQQLNPRLCSYVGRNINFKTIFRLELSVFLIFTKSFLSYLLKIGVQPADMATILCKSKSAISMIRTRMYEKIFGKSGTATALDEYIQNF